MSSRTWTPRAVASEVRRFAADTWRAVEAQHVVSTMVLVDTLEEQEILENVLEAGKPPVPADARRLHYLLFTPFRYRPPAGGSRFRGEDDAGVLYAADAIRTACAELGYWRWRHLLDSPALDAMPLAAQTVFRLSVDAPAVDLRHAPFAAERSRWIAPNDYRDCQAFGRVAREAAVQAIRYESVRDPGHGACCAVLSPGAFAQAAPREYQSWMLSVARERVVWKRAHATNLETHDFAVEAWRASLPARPAAPRARRKASKR